MRQVNDLVRVVNALLHPVNDLWVVRNDQAHFRNALARPVNDFTTCGNNFSTQKRRF